MSKNSHPEYSVPFFYISNLELLLKKNAPPLETHEDLKFLSNKVTFAPLCISLSNVLKKETIGISTVYMMEKCLSLVLPRSSDCFMTHDCEAESGP